MSLVSRRRMSSLSRFFKSLSEILELPASMSTYATLFIKSSNSKLFSSFTFSGSSLFRGIVRASLPAFISLFFIKKTKLRFVFIRGSILSTSVSFIMSSSILLIICSKKLFRIVLSSSVNFSKSKTG